MARRCANGHARAPTELISSAGSASENTRQQSQLSPKVKINGFLASEMTEKGEGGYSKLRSSLQEDQTDFYLQKVVVFAWFSDRVTEITHRLICLTVRSV